MKINEIIMDTKKIENLLIQKGVNVTANRLLVLKVFLEKNYALSLMDIKQELPWADRATIFRSLKMFEQKALIHHIDDGGKISKYALCLDSCEISHHHVHPHFHCERCDKTVCLSAQNIDIPNLPENFKVNSYSLIINGICEDCINLE